MLLFLSMFSQGVMLLSFNPRSQSFLPFLAIISIDCIHLKMLPFSFIHLYFLLLLSVFSQAIMLKLFPIFLFLLPSFVPIHDWHVNRLHSFEDAALLNFAIHLQYFCCCSCFYFLLSIYDLSNLVFPIPSPCSCSWLAFQKVTFIWCCCKILVIHHDASCPKIR